MDQQNRLKTTSRRQRTQNRSKLTETKYTWRDDVEATITEDRAGDTVSFSWSVKWAGHFMPVYSWEEYGFLWRDTPAAEAAAARRACKAHLIEYLKGNAAEWLDDLE